MSLLGSLLAVRVTAVGSILAVQRILRGLHNRWHRRDFILEDDHFVQ